MNLRLKSICLNILGIFLLNILIFATALAVEDTVNSQYLINQGSLNVDLEDTVVFFGSFDEGSANGTVINGTIVDLTIINTTGSSSPFTLSWKSENLQATTGVAAAGTGFNYAIDLEGEAPSSLSFLTNSLGASGVALSVTGASYNFPGSGASGTTSGDVDILTGSGQIFNLVSTFDMGYDISYTNQLPGLYSGDVTFTII